MHEKLYSLSLRTLLLFCGLFAAAALTAQNDCRINGGSLVSADGRLFTSLCLDDGTPTAADVVLTDNTPSTDTRYFATTPNGTILAVLDGDPPFEVGDIDEDAVVIFSVSYTGDLIGAMIGLNVCNLGSTDGCVAMSNPVVFNLREGDDCNNQPVCTANGGMLELADGSGTTTVRCLDNEGEGSVAVTLGGSPSGDNMTFLITDDQGNILSIPDGSGPFDLTSAGPGTCLIWYLSFDDGLTGLEVGNNPNDFDGCFALSNPVTVDRLTGEDCDNMDDNNFVAVLNGLNELPCPVTTTGFGNVTAMLNGNRLSVAGSFSGLTSDFDADVAGGAHLHLGPAGTGGPIAFMLDTDLDDDLRGGSFSADDNTFELSDEQAELLRARGLYVNIHTELYPGGEIRGQLVPAGADAYRAAYLLGVNEVPAVVTTAIGAVIVERYDSLIVLSGSFNGLSSEIATDLAGGAHIHTGITGRNGPILIPINLEIDDDSTAATILADSNRYVLSEMEQMALRNDMLYVNVHSENFRSGELRGQIAELGLSQFYSNPAGHQTRPEPINTPGRSRLLLSLSPDNVLTVSGSVDDLLSPVDVSIAGGAHLHLNVAGSNGPIVFELDYTPDGEGTGGRWMSRDNAFVLNDDQVEAFIDREYYVNVHTDSFPTGEVRGQVMNLAKGYFGSNLDGINSNPEAVKSTGGGFLMYELCGGFLTATGSFADLTSDFDASVAGGSHIHFGDAASTGGIVFGLDVDLADDLRAGVYPAADNRFAIDSAGRTALLAGNYYFNLHTVDFPAGEIRGQLLEDDNDFPTAVSIISPEDGATVTVFEGGSDLEEGSFTAAEDPDGDLLVYTIEITLPTDPDFNTILACEKVGTDTLSFASLDQVYDTLVAFGAVPGVSVNLLYRVVASDGSVATPSAPRTITLVVGDSSCEADGGELTFADGTTEASICVADGIDDPLSVTLTDTVGTNFTYVITDADANILALQADQPFNLENAGPGTCLIWALSFEDDLGGAEIGANATALTGCFDLSNPLTVRRNFGDDCDDDGNCEADGGVLSFTNGSDSTAICVGEGQEDPINVTLTDTVGTNFTYVITDANGNILALEADQPFSLEGAGAGTCLIWALSFEDDLTGADIGANASGLGGCFDLSNPLTVVRNTGDDCDDDVDCEADGGELTFTDGSDSTTICVGEGQDDLINVILTDTVGTNFTYVITDADGNILSLEADQPFSLEGAGAGTCLIWALSFEDDLTGADIGANASGLGGCFDLSNPLTVVRNTGDDCDNDATCDLEAGMIAFIDGTTTAAICVDDDVDELLAVDILDPAQGGTSSFVITDNATGVILSIPDNNGPFDLGGAGAGRCLIWYVTFDDTTEGLEVGSVLNDATGCLVLSNALTVIRDAGEDCTPNDGCLAGGGLLSFMGGQTDTTICVGEGFEDVLEVTITDTIGTNFTYVITNLNGDILSLQADQPFNLEGAGAGTCLIWGLSFEDDLTGAEIGMNATLLGGCFNLSNPLTVVRNEGDDCGAGLLTINEVDHRGMVEITNFSSETVDAGELFLVSNDEVRSVASLVIDCGTVTVKPGEFLVLDAGELIDPAGDELALTRGGDYASLHSISSYVAWGNNERRGERMATYAAVWTEGNAFEAPDATTSLQRDPEAEAMFVLSAPTLCGANTLSTSTVAPAADRLTVFPNPFTDRLTLEVEGLQGASELTVLDIAGRVVLQRQLAAGSTRAEIATDRLRRGTYLLRLTNDSGVSTARLVRQ